MDVNRDKTILEISLIVSPSIVSNSALPKKSADKKDATAQSTARNDIKSWTRNMHDKWLNPGKYVVRRFWGPTQIRNEP